MIYCIEKKNFLKNFHHACTFLFVVIEELYSQRTCVLIPLYCFPTCCECAQGSILLLIYPDDVYGIRLLELFPGLYTIYITMFKSFKYPQPVLIAFSPVILYHFHVLNSQVLTNIHPDVS